MRQIKFRAWFTLGGQSFMRQLAGFATFGKHQSQFIQGWFCHDGGFFTAPVNQVVVMQFTGLLDKAGKEIYEGDIGREEQPMETGDERRYYVCTWIAEWCRFSWLELAEYDDYINRGKESLDSFLRETYGVYEDEENYTVCGNIYQHPQMLHYGYFDELSESDKND